MTDRHVLFACCDACSFNVSNTGTLHWLHIGVIPALCSVPNTGFEREMTCRSWGQYNFETFDGLYFYYPGKCTYTLLRDCEDTTQSSVLVQVYVCNSHIISQER